MTTISHSATAEVPVDVGFAYVADYRTVPRWFFGVTRFDPQGGLDYGLGAIYDAELRIGPKAFTSVVQITEFEQDRLITLRSIAGFRTSSRWEFTPHADGRSRLFVEFTYDLPGGIAGRTLAKIVEPFAVQAVRNTEATLRRQLENASDAAD
ncbi:SRPBCC family protein [Tsukamurella sp. 8F]|uniref:SRPBCC family protein n=1 Tax=unclassified Tsukamurella TaxID=2633480 RepID=UPI0023B96A5A|nr:MULTISPECIES: SRPBCC family protein [unclassified Tsukamurella]MDF0532326.1 SRPBCC family protein [Tsukamurella sp. 8J]MDF0589414.1 SRPBCC family protein [Tsukamurella sp. 8F]